MFTPFFGEMILILMSICFKWVGSTTNQLFCWVCNIHLGFLLFVYLGVFPKIGVPQNGWFIMENPIKVDDLGVPLFSETSICQMLGFILLPWIPCKVGWVTLRKRSFKRCHHHQARWTAAALNWRTFLKVEYVSSPEYYWVVVSKDFFFSALFGDDFCFG